jgi:aminoglycoside phosphotransferase (APT) family kinase protein
VSGPAPWWPPAEIDVDESLVRRLLEAQHPDLARLPVRPAAEGWDNSSWRLGDDLLVRLPRRAMSAPLADKEHRWLRRMADGLPLPTPIPVRTGRPGPGFPWSWSIVPWLEGTSGDRAALTDPEGAAVALGLFLAALHRDAPPDAPTNPYRGGALEGRTVAFEERLGSLAEAVDGATARRVWQLALAAAGFAGPPRWLHGDLHPANVLVKDGTVVAVIDFGDLCAGDPATDLAGGWMLLPEPAYDGFLAAYGPVDEATLLRSYGWAALFAVMLTGIGLDRRPRSGRPSWLAVGRRTLASIGRRTLG